MRVLFITVIDFWKSTNTGGKMISKRNFNLLKSIYGEENVFYCGVGTDMEEYHDKNRISFIVKKNMFSVYYNYIFNRYEYSKKIEKNVINYVSKIVPDLVFLDGSWMGNILKKISCQYSIVFFHNIEASVTLKSIHVNKRFRPYRYLRYKCVKCNENYVAQHANYRICLNIRDSSILQNYYGQSADYYLPTAITDTYNEVHYVAIKENPYRLLFVGSYFPPNILGLDWFIRNVLCQINCKLIIVGAGMEKYVSPIKSEKIEIVGEVEDLSEYYLNASAVICPIFLGDGMKTKTAEAMMYGKTLFATDEALEGYEIEGVDNIYRCNTDEEFIESINVHFSRGRFDLFNEGIRKQFLDKYEFDSQHRKFHAWIEKMKLI